MMIHQMSKPVKPIPALQIFMKHSLPPLVFILIALPISPYLLDILKIASEPFHPILVVSTLSSVEGILAVITELSTVV